MELPKAERRRNLLPDPLVRKRYNISAMTLWRWDNDPALGFPKPHWIRHRKYRDEAALERWERERASATLPTNYIAEREV